MRHGLVFVPLAVAALLVAACTGNSHPSAHAGPSGARTSAGTGQAGTGQAGTGQAGTGQAGTGQAGTGQAGTGQAGAVTSDGCAGQPPVSPLPVWARAGFTPPDQAMPHVMGAAGNIVAILWVDRDALHSPSLPNGNNKILWVSKIPFVAPNPLVINATLAGSTRTVTVSVPGGPGPSTIDMPAPGCWTFHLSWSGHTDELKLRYVA